MTPFDYNSIPAVLVLSEEPFGLDNGFGVTLHNLFAGWPDEKLYVFYAHQHSKSDHNSGRRTPQIHCPVNAHHGRRYALPMLLGIKPQWREHYSRLWLNLHLKRFKPDVIYILLHSESTLLFGEWIAKSLKIPFVVHVADAPTFRNSKTPHILRSAAVRYAISEPMAREYRSRYDASFNILRNPASIDYYRDVANPRPMRSPRDRRLTIRYLGRLHSWLHYESLRLLGQAVNECDQAGVAWTVELYGSADEADLRKAEVLNSQVVYCGTVSRETGIKILQEADLLVLPLTYQPETIAAYKYSFPTKLAEYLATGVPILVLADEAAASVSFCQEHSVAHCITSPDVHLIKQFLSSFWSEPHRIIEEAKRNPSVCKSHFGYESTTLMFQNSLCAAASSHSVLGLNNQYKTTSHSLPL